MSTLINAKVQHKRGTEASIPTLLDGQIYLPFDKKRIWKGTSGGNVLISDYDMTLSNSAFITSIPLLENTKIPLSLNSGYTFDADVDNYYIKAKDNFARIYFGTIGIFNGNIWNVITTLPSGFRPSKTVFGSCNYSGLTFPCKIENTGVVSIFVPSTTSSVSVRGTIEYLATN